MIVVLVRHAQILWGNGSDTTSKPLLYLQVNVGNGVRSNTVMPKDSPCEILYVLNGVMTYGYK
jgi:hypothetical protein